MGLLCDYFLAGSDEEAAAAIDRVGGPGARSAPTPRRPVRRWHLRPPWSSEVEHLEAEDSKPYLVVDGAGIEPVIQMATLESILTARSADEVMGDDPVLAERDGGERMVVRLNDSLSRALAVASDDELREIALLWSETEEFWGQGEPEVLSGFLVELAALARRATQADGHLYCWLSV